jgi:hypothetical protein
MSSLHRIGLNKRGLDAICWASRNLQNMDFVKLKQLGQILAALYAAPKTIGQYVGKICDWIVNVFSAKITLDSNDRLYTDVMHYMSQIFESRGARNLAARTNTGRNACQMIFQYPESFEEQEPEPGTETQCQQAFSFYLYSGFLQHPLPLQR